MTTMDSPVLPQINGPRSETVLFSAVDAVNRCPVSRPAMKALYIAAVAALMLSTVLVIARDSTAHDAYWWSGLSNLEKIRFIDGFTMGTVAGQTDVLLQCISDVPEKARERKEQKTQRVRWCKEPNTAISETNCSLVF